MTVAELITELQRFNANEEVVCVIAKTGAYHVRRDWPSNSADYICNKVHEARRLIPTFSPAERPRVEILISKP